MLNKLFAIMVSRQSTSMKYAVDADRKIALVSYRVHSVLKESPEGPHSCILSLAEFLGSLLS